jgi:hypothetical protein
MAAGLGFKTFTTGEVLTAADTNGYLMQGVLVFASSAARAAAITSPQEGQYSYLKDTNSTEYYDGAAWIAAPIGDITGVTAGVGITGGGTSGTVTVTNDMATTITAAGDIVVGTGSGTYDNLPIGTTAQVLTADTTVSPYKVKWATPATTASGLTKVTSASFSAVANTSTTFDGVFTSAYKNYQIVIIGKGSAGMDLRFNWREAGVTYAGSTYSYGSFRIPYGGATSTTQTTATYFVPMEMENVVTQQLANIYAHGIGVSSNPVYTWTAAGYGNNLRGSINGGGITNAGLTVTGFILTASTGTITGECFIYGLAN